MGKITYSEYSKEERCCKCGWINRSSIAIATVCPKCGDDIDWVTGRFVYEHYKPTTIKEKILHAIFGETKKLIDFEIKGEKND